MEKRSAGAVSRLPAPFLKRAVFTRPAAAPLAYPWTLPILARDRLEIAFDKRVTIVCGENGSGKSTILGAIAVKCGFNLRSGNRDHVLQAQSAAEVFEAHLRLSWLPLVAQGFFFRAESITDFNQMIDGDATLWTSYGGRSPEARSHGEGALSVMRARFDRGGVFILDEPEAALSPLRQAALVSLMTAYARNTQCQFIVATHSPIVMSCPGAALFEIRNGRLQRCAPSETQTYRLYVDFFLNPRAFIDRLSDGQMDFLDDLYRAF